MENTMKTMEKVLEQMLLELKDGNFQAVKTLINTYQSLLASIISNRKETLSKYAKMLENQRVLFETLYIKVNDIIWEELENKNYKHAHTLTYVSDTFKKSSRNIDHLLNDLIRQPNLPQNKEKKVEEKEDYKLIDEMIEFSLKHNVIVQMQKEQYRGIGKTTKLAKKAQEMNAVLVVPSYAFVKHLEKQGYKNIICTSSTDFGRGARLKNGFIVDEGVAPEILKELSKRFKLLGGISAY